MAYTDSEGKIILKAWHPFRGYAYEALTCGELCSQDTTNEGFIPADAGDSELGIAIAMEDIAASGTGWLCTAALVGCQPSESTGVWSTGAFFAAGDVTSYLYIGESGLVSLSSGTYKQLAGFVVSTSQMFLSFGGDISNAAGWFEGLTASGNVSANDVIIGKNHDATLVKGNLTLTNGAVVHTKGGYTMTKGTFSVATGNINISTAGNINVTEGDLELKAGNTNLDSGDIALTSGNLNMSSGNLILTSGNLKITDGYIQEVLETKITANKTMTVAQCGIINVDATGQLTVLTLPTAAAGQMYHIIHFKGANNLNIVAGGSDYILANSGKFNLIYDNKGLDARVTLRAIDAVSWVADSVLGTWASKNA